MNPNIARLQNLAIFVKTGKKKEEEEEKHVIKAFQKIPKESTPTSSNRRSVSSKLYREGTVLKKKKTKVDSSSKLTIRKTTTSFNNLLELKTRDKV